MQMPLEIIGEDEREEITATSKQPWSMQGHLVMTFKDNKSIERTEAGSGTMIGPRHVLTAGHNVYKKDYGRALSTTFYPGQTSGKFPFDSAEVIAYKIAPRWLESGDSAWDFAVLVLDRPVGTKTGKMGLAVLSDTELMAKRLTLAGYPKNKEGTLWSASGLLRDVSDEYLFYDIDTEPGQSGSCLFYSSGTTHTIVGVHTVGDKKAGNSGVRIDSERAKMIRSWL
jgi:V8-like Glu-specific endopeptidase